MDGPSQLKLHYSSTQFVILTRSTEVEWWLALSFVARLVGYIILLALIVIFISLILKCLGDCDCERTTAEEVTERETCPLCPNKATIIPCTYGTCAQDLESGNCSSSSSEDLYDGKICVICYDQPRNCFFVPCGHCATCHDCAQRIFDGESKTCPVCRRFIGKVKKLFTTSN